LKGEIYKERSLFFLPCSSNGPWNEATKDTDLIGHVAE